MYKSQKLNWIYLITLAAASILINGCGQKNSEPAFNVPALLGKKVDAVSAALNVPAVDTPPRLQPPAVAGEEVRTFIKDNWYLVTIFRPDTGKVVSFTIGTDEEGGILKEKQRFLQAGTLQEGDPLYTVEYIESPDTIFSYSGVKITPQPISHNVTFRVTGSEDVFYINYSLRPAAGPEKSNKFVTVPPWKESFTAETGAQLTLEATPSSQAVRRNTTGPMQATVQILIDGKVAQESKLVGLWAKCAMEIEY